MDAAFQGIMDNTRMVADSQEVAMTPNTAWLCVVASVGVLVAGCGASDPLSSLCGECAAGHRCGLDNECHALCTSVEDCGSCEACFEGLCYPLTESECRASATACGAESCPDGCCQGSACHEASPTTCGTAGGGCVDCTADHRADTCSADKGCVCAAAGERCPEGETCDSTGCVGPCEPECGCVLPWGGTIAHGGSVTAYAAAGVSCGSACASETRVCANGILSGSFTSPSCAVQSCACPLPWGGTIADGQSVTAYQASSVPSGNVCVHETRVCTQGTLSGSYAYQSCQVNAICTSGIAFTFMDYNYGRATCSAVTPSQMTSMDMWGVNVPATSCVPGTSNCMSSSNNVRLLCNIYGQWMACTDANNCAMHVDGSHSGSGWILVGSGLFINAAWASCE